MARLEGITGGLSGKMGSAVFRQSGGKTIASQYQPIVKNPNSEGQQNTRAAFKLMSQLAAVMSAGFGSFIIKTRKEKGKASQRNAFFQINYPLVEVSKGTDGVEAKIPMEQVKLTSSFRPLPSLTLNGDGMLTVDMSNISNDVTTVRLVIVGYGKGQAEIVNIVDVPVNSGAFTYENDTLPTGKFTVLAYGLIPSESAKTSIDLDNIHTPEDEDFISAVQLAAMVANGTMVETMTVGKNVTITSI